MSIREEQCNKVCRILDDVLANRPTERDSLIIAVRKAFEALELFGNSEQLPSAQPDPEWIPCSERLPIEPRHYLCSFNRPNRIDKIYVDLAYWTGGRWCGYRPDQINAWMPLPKPYKEKMNENADKFKSIFELYATELWSMPEEDFLKWLNSESIETEQRWIPCSRRLPDDLAEVNVTYVNHDPEPYYVFTKDKPYTASAVYYKGNWYWYSSTCADYLGEYGRNDVDKVDDAIEITAWKPLPEPYKEGEQNETD